MKLNLEKITGFDWDEFNRDKNWLKHRVSNAECEHIFFNTPLIIAGAKEGLLENRWAGLGVTNVGRKLGVVFTIRSNRIRVISARSMTQKEVRVYESEQKKTEDL